MLMRLTIGVNFINFKRTNFLYEMSFWQLFSSDMYVKNEKFVRLMLIKFTTALLVIVITLKSTFFS